MAAVRVGFEDCARKGIFEPLTVTDQVPSIDVSQTSLDFGRGSLGQSKDLSLTIRNVGTNQLTVNSLTSNNSQFSVPSPTAPFTIAPGGQQTVTVRFTQVKRDACSR